MDDPKNLQRTIDQAAEYINKIAGEAGISHRITSADKMILEKFVREFLEQVFNSASAQAHSKQCSQEMDQLWKRITS